MDHVFDAQGIRRAVLVGVAQRCAKNPNALAISALDAAGLDAVKNRICDFLATDAITLKLQVPQSEGKLLSQLYVHSEILTRDYKGNDVHLRVRLNSNHAERMQLDRFLSASRQDVLA